MLFAATSASAGGIHLQLTCETRNIHPNFQRTVEFSFLHLLTPHFYAQLLFLFAFIFFSPWWSELEAFNLTRYFGYCFGGLCVPAGAHAPRRRRGAHAAQPEQILAELHPSAVRSSALPPPHYKALLEPATATKCSGSSQRYHCDC